MHETELWITKLFNEHLAGVGNTLTGFVGMKWQPAPWANFVTMQLVVAAIIIVLFAFLKPRLSADHPGKLQHTCELVYDFLREQAQEQVGHEGHHYLAYFGTIFIFILFSKLIGIIPGMAPRRRHRVQGGRGRNQPQGQALVRREGESQAGAEASSKNRAAEGQKSGLKSGIDSGVCYGRRPFLGRPSSPPEGRS